MNLRQQIERALNTPFNAAKQGLDEATYHGLGVYHDGPTLKTSTVVIQRELNTDSGTLTSEGKWIPTPDPTARTSIDIKSPIGQNKGSIKDIIKLRNRFLNLTRHLPEGSYYLHADDHTKAKYYQRVFKDHPWINLSGEQGGSRTKSGEFVKYDTLKLRIPDAETRLKQMVTGPFRDWQTQGVPHDDKSLDIAQRTNAQANMTNSRNMKVKVDENGLVDPSKADIAKGLPKSTQEAIDRGINVYQDKSGKAWKLRFKTRRPIEIFNGKEYQFERSGWNQHRITQKLAVATRRANKKAATITLNDYFDFARRNGYSDEAAKTLYEQNQNRLRRLIAKSQNLPPTIIKEHLNPLRNFGSVEHWRNKIFASQLFNDLKSDIVPTREALKRAGVPLNKQAALQMDFQGVPRTPPKIQRQIIGTDIQNQIDSGVPKRARFSIPKAIPGSKVIQNVTKTGVGGRLGGGPQTLKINRGRGRGRVTGRGTGLASTLSSSQSDMNPSNNQLSVFNRERKRKQTYGNESGVGDTWLMQAFPLI